MDPLKPDMNKSLELENVSSFEVRVNEGDILYLPSLWHHHVRQSQGCIGIYYRK